MFIFDWLLDWIYAEIIKFVQDFFSSMGNMGTEIFDFPWVQGVVEFFRLFGWSLYVIGLVVTVFDVAIAMQSGRSNGFRDVGINAIKGFLAVNLFTVLPIELYKLTITLQGQLGDGIATLFQTSHQANLMQLALSSINGMVMNATFINLFFVIALGYCVIKIFFANIKRGGIMLINMAVGSLYMFSVPRGYNDGFMVWCKQVIALCITAFLQMTLLTAGLITFADNMILDIGIMLAANEVPRIADTFGLDTSARVNVMSTYYAAQAAINTTKSIMKVIKK